MAPEYPGGSCRVLMLAYYFPPLGGAGVQRVVKFVKYLAQLGWDPTVITTRSTVYPVLDPTMAADVPSTARVIRAREPRGAMGPATLLGRAGFRRAAQVAAFPDAAVGWAPDAIRQSLRSIRNDPPAVLFSTSAPYTSHLVALAVHRRTGIPWVADFRDEWSSDPAVSDHPPIVRRLARRLEREIAAAASAITVVGDYFEIANTVNSPRTVIPNGVDDSDLLGLDSPPPTDGLFRLSFVGTLYGERDVKPVLAALERLASRDAIDPDRFRLRIVGNDRRPPGQRQWPVPIELVGYVSHREALREMRSASALLHYVPMSSRAPGGKIFEYLASARPVLCVARSDNDASEFVHTAGAGLVASPDDPRGIEAAVLALYQRWSTFGLPDQPDSREWVLAHYSRRDQASELAQVLARAVKRGREAAA